MSLKTTKSFASIVYHTKEYLKMVAKASDLISQNKFFMSSKSWCPDCKYAKSVFNKYNCLDKVKIVELDKMSPKEAAPLEDEITAIAGRKWVPTIFFNGKIFGTEQTLKDLERKGKTEETFKKAGLI